MENGKEIEREEKEEKKKKIYGVITGLIAGITNGLFGGGGGMIVVPMLTGLLKYKPQKAHATAILIILPLSIISGLFYAFFGTLNIRLCIPVTIGVIIGGSIGALLLNKITSKWLTVIFSVVMAIAGIKMLIF